MRAMAVGQQGLGRVAGLERPAAASMLRGPNAAVSHPEHFAP